MVTGDKSDTFKDGRQPWKLSDSDFFDNPKMENRYPNLSQAVCEKNPDLEKPNLSKSIAKILSGKACRYFKGKKYQSEKEIEIQFHRLSCRITLHVKKLAKIPICW